MSQREEETKSRVSFFDSLVSFFKRKGKKDEWISFLCKPRLTVCEVELFDEPDDWGYTAEVKLFQNNELVSKQKVFPGDFCRIAHNITISCDSQVKKDSPIFPIELEYAGETYYLRATKNDKLILTK